MFFHSKVSETCFIFKIIKWEGLARKIYSDVKSDQLRNNGKRAIL